MDAGLQMIRQRGRSQRWSLASPAPPCAQEARRGVRRRRRHSRGDERVGGHLSRFLADICTLPGPMAAHRRWSPSTCSASVAARCPSVSYWPRRLAARSPSSSAQSWARLCPGPHNLSPRRGRSRTPLLSVAKLPLHLARGRNPATAPPLLGEGPATLINEASASAAWSWVPAPPLRTGAASSRAARAAARRGRRRWARPAALPAAPQHRGQRQAHRCAAVALARTPPPRPRPRAALLLERRRPLRSKACAVLSRL